MKTLKKYRWPLTGALLGALIFLLLYGVRVLDPTSVDWILNNPSPDPAQHYLGWELFRRSPVHLPYIGANYNAVYPFRTSVLFTDSLPLAALLFKLLGGILPTRFQYFGWWGLFCYMMQGGLAQAVIARIAGVQPTFDRGDKSKAAIAIIMSPGQTAKLWGSVLGAGVLVLFPALTMRTFAHEALAGTWLVLLALYLWLRSDELMSATRALGADGSALRGHPSVLPAHGRAGAGRVRGAPRPAKARPGCGAAAHCRILRGGAG